MKTALLSLLIIVLQQAIYTLEVSVLEVENEKAVAGEPNQLICTTDDVNSAVRFEHPKSTIIGTCLSSGFCSSTNYDMYQDRPESKTYINITSYDRGRDDGEWLCVKGSSTSNSKNLIGYVRPTSVTAIPINNSVVHADEDLTLKGEAYCIAYQKMSAKLLTKKNCENVFKDSKIFPTISYKNETSKCAADELVAEATVVLSNQFRGDKIRFKMQFTHDVLLTQLTSPETIEIMFESSNTTNTISGCKETTTTAALTTIETSTLSSEYNTTMTEIVTKATETKSVTGMSTTTLTDGTSTEMSSSSNKIQTTIVQYVTTNSYRIGYIIGFSVGGICLIAVVIFGACCYYQRKKKNQHEHKIARSDTQKDCHNQREPKPDYFNHGRMNSGHEFQFAMQDMHRNSPQYGKYHSNYKDHYNLQDFKPKFYDGRQMRSVALTIKEYEHLDTRRKVPSNRAVDRQFVPVYASNHYFNERFHASAHRHMYHDPYNMHSYQRERDYVRNPLYMYYN